MISLDDALATEYLAECREHLATIEADLLTFEKGEAEVSEDRINRVFRAVHSIKGGAGFFDLSTIRDLAHRMEDLFALIRAGSVAPTPDRIHVLLRASDRLSELIQDPGGSNQADVAGIMAELAQLPADERAGAGERCLSGSEPVQPGGRRLRSLLVEDEFASRLLLQSFLSSYGECHIAVDGREAVEAFGAALDRGEKYDLVCMDIMMPVMDGREAVHRMRAMEEARGISSTYGVKIVMTTAVTDIKEVIRCFQELCDSYLMKPIDLNLLLSQLKALQLIQSRV
jgi:two-component system chemotaxis response regulator CheY